MKKVIDHGIVVQMWDPIMFMLDDEGPYPMQALCTGLHLISNEDDKPQAYISLKDVRCIKTPGGYDGRSRLLNSSCEGESLLSLAYIYEISCGDPPCLAWLIQNDVNEGREHFKLLVQANGTFQSSLFGLATERK